MEPHNQAATGTLISRPCLSCRTDYPGWSFWKKLGFPIVRDRPGRAKKGSTLTDFYYELNQSPLFPSTDEQGGTRIAVDANVFFDIKDKERPHHGESIGLVADWLSAEIELCLPASIEEDLSRSNNKEIANEIPEGWSIATAAPSAFQSIFEQLCSLLGPGQSEQDTSDRNHLSHAIAENMTAFITRDQFLLDRANGIYERFGIAAQRPSDFIAEIDTVLHQDQYDRHDVESVGFALSRVASEEEITEVSSFRRGDEREAVLTAIVLAGFSEELT